MGAQLYLINDLYLLSPRLPTHFLCTSNNFMIIFYSSLDEQVDTNNFSPGVIAWPGLPMPELLDIGRTRKSWKKGYLLASKETFQQMLPKTV